jgi:uncharacterized coiled-coil protein SlyX
VTTDWRDTRIAELEAELSAKDVELSSRDARIAELEQRVATLAKQVAELVEKLGRDSRNSHLPPSSDPPGSHAGKGKKSGAWLYAAVCERPGETMSVLAPIVGATARELNRPATRLRQAGRIRSVGTRHATRYFPMAEPEPAE